MIPETLGWLDFDVRYQGKLVHLHFTPDQATMRVDPIEGGPILIDVRGDRRTVHPGETVEFDLAGLPADDAGT